MLVESVKFSHTLALTSPKVGGSIIGITTHMGADTGGSLPMFGHIRPYPLSEYSKSVTMRQNEKERGLYDMYAERAATSEDCRPFVSFPAVFSNPVLFRLHNAPSFCVYWLA